MRRHFLICLLYALLPALVCAQPVEPAESTSVETPLDGREGRMLALPNFRPEPTLRVPQHLLTHAKFPVVDSHTHFFYKMRHSQEQLDAFVKLMDKHGIAVCNSLDGRLGDQLDEHMKYLWTDYKDRFTIFVNIDWVGQGDREDPQTYACHRPGFVRHTVEQLKQAKAAGASGLKLFKQFGLGYKNPDGTLMQIDDPRWDPIWQACGQLKLPVLIHTADPAAFFEPIDETNERWEELHRHPDWSFYGEEFPSREQLLAARNRVIARHKQTLFIGAHVANNAEDLATVAKWLEAYPNLYIEPASRIGELGRQPYTARKFMIEHADRILFGTDGPWPELRLTYYWRFLETHDENFPYSEKEFPPQGFWRIYGVGLPDDVLRKIYHENAEKIIPGVAQRMQKWRVRESEGQP
jgi:predicted TIM-barrel fold metal-dependent hydrolase